jgi:hypothetical protein
MFAHEALAHADLTQSLGVPGSQMLKERVMCHAWCARVRVLCCEDDALERACIAYDEARKDTKRERLERC